MQWGTAPAFRVEHQGCQLYFMPGVPREMKPIFEMHVRPHIASMLEGPRPVRHIVRTIGTAESVQLATIPPCWRVWPAVVPV